MESITNAANAASKAVFGGSTGQSGQEPVSGQTGRGTASEPYDAGNTMGNVSQSIALPFRSPLRCLLSVPIYQARVLHYLEVVLLIDPGKELSGLNLTISIPFPCKSDVCDLR